LFTASEISMVLFGTILMYFIRSFLNIIQLSNLFGNYLFISSSSLYSRFIKRESNQHMRYFISLRRHIWSASCKEKELYN